MCEALFELFGTSSEEIAANAAKEATEKAEKEADAKIQLLTKEKMSLVKENSILHALLIQNGIPLPE